MRKLCILLALVLTAVPAMLTAGPFKPYQPLSEIDWHGNWLLQRDSLSIAHSMDCFPQNFFLPVAITAATAVYNDNILDRTILREGHATQPELRIANTLQYLPVGAAAALKLAGVEGRSDWPRFITASIFAYVAETAFTQILKYTVDRPRPYGANNSYPSGHTATAFVGATILHKEYGETVGPWISVAGYAMASATGMMRILANRHWTSDVLAGAGFGIMSAEIAYELNAALFGDIRLKQRAAWTDTDERTPWKFGLQTFCAVSSDSFIEGTGCDGCLKPAYSTGLTASYTPWFVGPALYAGFTQMQWTGSGKVILPEWGQVRDIPCVGAGLAADIPVAGRLGITGQSICGYSFGDGSYHFVTANTGEPVDWSHDDNWRFNANIGLSLRTSSCSSMSVFAGFDYFHTVWRSWTAGTQFNLVF